jgi:hypothetical protein
MNLISNKNNDEANDGENKKAKEPWMGYKKCLCCSFSSSLPPEEDGVGNDGKFISFVDASLAPFSDVLVGRIIPFNFACQSTDLRSSRIVLLNNSFLVAGRRGLAVAGTSTEYSPVLLLSNTIA